MSAKKTIIIASVIICLLLIGLLYMDQKVRKLESKVDDTGEEQDLTDITTTPTDTTPAKDEVKPKEEVKKDTSDEVVDHPGILSVKSVPTGAKVYLNGTSFGVTPYINSSIPAGTYDVKLLKAGYKDYTKEVTIYYLKTREMTALLIDESQASSDSSDDTTDDADTEDEDDAGSSGMKFTSDPSGAEVKINGAVKGITPIRIVNLTDGQVLLKISKVGYLTYSAFVNIGTDGFISSIDSDSEQNGNSTYVDDDEYDFELIED